MNENLTHIQISEFNQKIGLKSGIISRFFDDVLEFNENKLPRIVDYFSGKTSEVSEDGFRMLSVLTETFESIEHNIDINKNNLEKFLDWEITDFIEDLGNELYFYNKISKFLRSTLTNSNYSGSMEFDYTTSGGETLEDVSREFVDKNDYNDDWVDIALKNDLSELDYDSEKSSKLKLNVSLVSRTSNIKGVVDNIVGKRVLGIDIQQRIEFLDNDIKTLSYDETAEQSVKILANMLRGDNPEFEDMGRTPIVGANKNSIIYTSTIREMSNTFSSDDTLLDFSVTEIEPKENSDVNLKFEVSTRASQILNQEINI